MSLQTYVHGYVRNEKSVMKHESKKLSTWSPGNSEDEKPTRNGHLQERYGVLEQEGKVEMLRRMQKGRKGFESHLKGGIEEWLENTPTGLHGLAGQKLFERVVELVPDDKWMRFVRLHLRMEDDAIERFRMEHCKDEKMYSVIDMD